MNRALMAAVAILVTCGLSAAAQQSPELRAYQSCSFPDGLQVLDTQSMPADVHDRPAQTHGVTSTIPLVAGERIIFGYDGIPYANVKVEQLPAENFVGNRKLLLDDFSDIVASDKGVVRNTAHKPTQSGFSITGLDRKTLDGNTLGIYLLIDDSTHIASTIYFLNADPAKRRFKTPEEYGHMRETFLYNYTKCVRNNQTGNIFGVAR